ncbi:MAG: 2-(1,2-epoxy-1,2-dihydrophenyl)acetyl-CoA isomerase PaaG [Candidatus Velthaea sp.]
MIDIAIDQNVATITLNRPAKMNAIDDATAAALTARIAELEAHGARALVIRGEGRAFCAGRDLAAIADPANDDGEGVLRDIFNPLFLRIAELPIPTFAAVGGVCLGAGMGLAFACDVVYATKAARFGVPFTRIGAVLDSGGHAYLAERIGSHRALELIYSGEFIDGETAAAWGLINRCLPDDELLPRTVELARRVVAGPRVALRESKRIVRRIERERLSFQAVLEAEAVAQGVAFRDPDYAEGIAAFREKREPRFGTS